MPPAPPPPLALAGLGATVAALGTVAGMGGGFLLVPALTLGFGVSMHAAVGASLAAILAATAVASVANWRAGKVEARVAVVLEAAALVGAAAGARVALGLPGPTLRVVFGLVSLGVGVGLTRRGSGPPAPAPGPRRRGAVATLGGAAGFLAGLLGVGGGFLKTPGLMLYAGLSAERAAATSLATVAVTATAGVLVYLKTGHLAAGLAGPLAAGALAGAAVGVRVGRRLADRTRARVVAASLVLGGLAMLVPRP